MILSIGMSYYQGGCNTNHRQVSSAQTNQTQVLTWEKHISTTLAFIDFRACSWLGWIALETSFPESLRSLKTEFGVKRYDVFREVTCAVSESCGSTTHKGGSAAPVQVLMASFWTPMASFGFGCIYTHPTAPGLAADDQNITKPCEDSQLVSKLWRSYFNWYWLIIFNLVYQEICLQLISQYDNKS